MHVINFSRGLEWLSYLIFFLLSLTQPTLAAGQLDLSNHDLTSHHVYPLDADWLIAWDNFYSPTDIPKNASPYAFPGVWNNIIRPDGSSGPYGIATLYLEVEFPKDLSGIYLKLSDLPSSGTLWGNGVLLIEQGKIAHSAENERPGFGPETVYLPLPLTSKTHAKTYKTAEHANKVLFALHTSNFHYKEGGAWTSIEISGHSGFRHLATLPAIADAAQTVLLLVLGGLFLSLYLVRRQEKAALFFGCFCLAVGIRSGITGEHIINHIFPIISWSVSQKLEYILLFASVPLFLAFSHQLYPQYRSKKAEVVFLSISGFFSLFTLITPSTLFTLTSLPFQIIIISCLIYLLRIGILALLHKRKSANTYLLSFLLLSLLVLCDVLTHNMVIQLPFMSEWGVALFVIIQAWLLNQRYAFSLNNEEALSQRLTLQNQELKTLDAMKDDFLAQTSHELRTPIHGIASLSELVLSRETRLDKESATNLQLIHSSSVRLANLVNDILDLSSIKHNQLKLSLSAVSLAPIIEQVTLSLRPLLKGRPITLETTCPDWLPKVMADENRLQQVLFNLVGNAIKFTTEGHILIQTEMVDKDRVRISIKDTGLGIDLSNSDAIFEAYNKGQHHQHSASGHGLGLTITRNLLQMHHSQLNIKSVPGHGSTFSFELEAATHLPISVQEITSRAHIQATPSARPPEKERRFHDRPIGLQTSDTQSTNTQTTNAAEHPFVIWAVDDEPVNLQIIENQLHNFGYHSRSFTSGYQLLLALDQDEQPDVLLLDVMMPGLNGLDVCQIIREQYTTQELPIIMLTARQQTQDIVQAFEAGACDYLAKPYDQAELKVRVQAQLNASLCNELIQSNDSLLSNIAQKESQAEQLEHQNHLLLNALNLTNTPIAVLNQDFESEYQNLAMTQLIARHPEYFKNKQLTNLTELIQDNASAFCESTPWITSLDTIQHSLFVHRFTHEQQTSYSVILENNTLDKVSKDADDSHIRSTPDDLNTIEQRITLLEDIVIQLTEQKSLSRTVNSLSEVTQPERQAKPPTSEIQSTDPDIRKLLVEATRLALRLWEKHTGKTKTELAELSNIWRVYIDGGSLKTRTLDKYLNEKTLPKRPRWRSVLKTIDYVSQECEITIDDQRKLEALYQQIEQYQVSL